MAKKKKKDDLWIQQATKKKTAGAFTRQAERAGLGVQQFAKRVLADKPTKTTPTGRYTERTRRRAEFAETMEELGEKKRAKDRKKKRKRRSSRR
ncbi:hypothetical protein LCGC14_1946280 [marine sediment metagenome]|uniref:Uncharacterized protein n=1 Tax=marine sediment metagenome TaxID=412755 RepID=A0A0F9G771_9ZZZZ